MATKGGQSPREGPQGADAVLQLRSTFPTPWTQAFSVERLLGTELHWLESHWGTILVQEEEGDEL